MFKMTSSASTLSFILDSSIDGLCYGRNKDCLMPYTGESITNFHNVLGVDKTEKLMVNLKNYLYFLTFRIGSGRGEVYSRNQLGLQQM